MNSSMAACSSTVNWTFVVPPANSTRIVITQRRDGPFLADAVGGRGHYYASVEDLGGSAWVHRAGASCGGLRSFLQAEQVAKEMWARECEKVSQP